MPEALEKGFDHLAIPKGLNLSAQGCEERATLGEKTDTSQL